MEQQVSIGLYDLEQILDKERLIHGTNPLTSINRIQRDVIEHLNRTKKEEPVSSVTITGTINGTPLGITVNDPLNWKIETFKDDKFTPFSIRRYTSLKPDASSEVFAIGDYVTNGTRMKGHIIRFELSDDLRELFVYTDWSNIGMNLDSITKCIKLPSAYQVGDPVIVEFEQKKSMNGKITKVGFTPGKVLYDVEIEVVYDHLDEKMTTRIHSIDSVFVKKKHIGDVSPE